MDSVTQFVLGASIGAACLGKRHGLRKAALAGGILATLPDLDVFYDYGGPVENFVQHRSVTHSLIIQTLATPVIGEVLWRLLKKPDGRGRMISWLTVWLCFVTHGLLDNFTVYGTQLLWPLTDFPFAIGSVFIIDPAYTLPLLIITIWALIQGQWGPAFRKGLITAFTITTAYLGWSLAAQAWMQTRAEAVFAAHDIPTENLLVGPMPLSTGFWKIVALAPDYYVNLYLPLGGDDAKAPLYKHARWPDQMDCMSLDDIPAHALLRDFSKGFFRIEESADGKLYQADLRMGITPDYAFRYRIGNRASDDAWRVSPVSKINSNRNNPGDLDWLMTSFNGSHPIRPREADAVIQGDQPEIAGAAADCYQATKR